MSPFLFSRTAQAQWDFTRETYGSRFISEVTRWFESVVLSLGESRRPADRDLDYGLTKLERLGVGLRAFDAPDQWSILDEVRGLFHALFQRKPPYELWLAAKRFRIEPRGAALIVEACLALDRIRRQVVVTRIVGFPLIEIPDASSDLPAQTNSVSPNHSGVEVGTAAWEDLTAARVQLIDKKYVAGLDDGERRELARLQRLSAEALERAFPCPRLSPEELALVTSALGASDEVGRA